MTDIIEQLIGEEESRSRTVYPDSRGYETIAIGCCVDRRVKGTGLCDAAIDAQFAHDRANADAVCARIPNFGTLGLYQQAALVSVAFQLGDQILGWKHFMAGMSAKDVNAAGDALLDSDWARVQTPRRAAREVAMLQQNIWVPHAAGEDGTLYFGGHDKPPQPVSGEPS